MEEKKGNVSYVESIPVAAAVGKWIKEKGFSLATTSGVASEEPESNNGIGILTKLYSNLSRREMIGLSIKNSLLCILSDPPKHNFLGVIWLDNATQGATKNNWVFELNGKTNKKLAESLAIELADTFKVGINIRLVQEETCPELIISNAHYI